MALGIVVSGSSVGGVVWPIALRRMIDEIGFGWALRTVGFIALALSLFASFTVKARLPPRKTGRLFAPELFRIPAYSLLCLGLAFIFFGLFFIFFYLPTYAISKGVDSNLSFYSLSILNATSFVSWLLCSE
jgi:hypothetical protein